MDLLNEIHPTSEYDGVIFSKIKILSSSYFVSLQFSDYWIFGSEIEVMYSINRLKKVGKLMKVKYVINDNKNLDAHDSCLSICKLDNFKPDQYSKSFTRALIRAQKNIECDILTGKKAVTYFFKKHREYSYEKFKRVPLPNSFTRNLHKHFKDNCIVLSAVERKSGKICSQILIIKNKKSLHYKYGWSDSGMLHLRPNNILFHELCTNGIQDNITTIDLGHTWNKAKDLLRFKKNISTDILPAGQVTINQNTINNNIYQLSMKAVRYLTKQEVKYRPLREIPLLEKTHKWCC